MFATRNPFALNIIFNRNDLRRYKERQKLLEPIRKRHEKELLDLKMQYALENLYKIVGDDFFIR